MQSHTNTKESIGITSPWLPLVTECLNHCPFLGMTRTFNELFSWLILNSSKRTRMYSKWIGARWILQQQSFSCCAPRDFTWFGCCRKCWQHQRCNEHATTSYVLHRPDIDLCSIKLLFSFLRVQFDLSSSPIVVDWHRIGRRLPNS